MSQKLTVYAIVGPTASGKSSLAMSLAQACGGEIVSCDSMQVYRRMDIGTAKPTPEERAAVAHHMIDIVEPSEQFSCADYVTLADAAIRDICARGRLPIICGGTGLYLDALLRGEDFRAGITDESLRAQLLEFASVNGAQALHDQLREVDPESADAIHPNNVKRVARAIEIYRLSGVKKSEIDRESKLSQDRYDIKCVGLRYTDRAVLYGRIDRRVDQMMEQGLERETRELLAKGVFDVNTTAAQAIGYKELLDYLGGRETLVAAQEKLKAATRRYAKRQMTWFGAKDFVHWIDVCDGTRQKTFEEIVNIASELFF